FEVGVSGVLGHGYLPVEAASGALNCGGHDCIVRHGEISRPRPDRTIRTDVGRRPLESRASVPPWLSSLTPPPDGRYGASTSAQRSSLGPLPCAPRVDGRCP